MADIIDRPGSLGADRVSGLTNDSLMKADPIWAQLRQELANTKALLNELKAQHNALLAKLDADSGDTGGDSDYAATVAVASPDCDL